MSVENEQKYFHSLPANDVVLLPVALIVTFAGLVEIVFLFCEVLKEVF